MRCFLLRATVLLAMPLACAGGGSPPPVDPDAPGTRLGATDRVHSVHVEPGSSLSEKQLERLGGVNGLDGLAGRLMAELQSRGIYDEQGGDIELEVAVTHFWLRSASATFWIGSYAGNDSIAVSVVVNQGSRAINIFNTDTSSLRGGMIGSGTQGRYDHLIDTLAKRIADGL